MKLDETVPAEERQRWKVVRTDSYRDMPGLIVSADEATGQFVLQVHGENQQFDLGHHGIKIMPRGRR